MEGKKEMAKSWFGLCIFIILSKLECEDGKLNGEVLKCTNFFMMNGARQP